VSRASTLDADVAAYLYQAETVRNLSPHTLRAYRTDLADLVAGLGALEVTEASAVDLFLLRRWLTTLRDRRLAPRSVARRISAVRAFFGWLADARRIGASPAEGLRLPRRPRSLPSVLRGEEVRRLLEHEEGEDARSWRSARDRALLETLYSTGARVSEVASLDLRDIDLVDGTALLQGKGRRERLAGLGRPCREALEDYLALAAGVRRDRRAVFLNRFGTRLTTRGIARVLEKRVVRAGLPAGVTPHTLRHSFATHMLQAGANLREVQELLGHRSVASTQIYTHLTLDHLMQVYERAHPRAGRERRP
jgi:integrase/recombinase XerC